VPFFCGVVDRHPGNRLARAGWSWPMSRLDMRESDLHVYTPVLVGRWTLDIPYAGIDEAVLHHHRWGGRIRLRRNDGDVIVTTMGRNYVRIADGLQGKGITVTGDRGSATTSG
jgi:hypothetical protein